MHPEALVNDWMQRIKLGDGQSPKLDDRGAAYITLGETLTLAVTVNAEARKLALAAPLLSLPEATEGALLRSILVLNLPLLAGRNASLAADAETDRLLLVRTMPLDGLDAGSFETLLGDTMLLAQDMQKALQQARRDGPAESESVDDGGDNGAWIRV